jgi:hypothetical protein
LAAAGNDSGLENLSAATLDIFRAEPKTLALQRPGLIARLVDAVKSSTARTNATDLASILRAYPTWSRVDECARASWFEFLNLTLGFSALATDPSNAALHPLLSGASVSDFSGLNGVGGDAEGAALQALRAGVLHPAQVISIEMQSLVERNR